jgi:hypothetical protein
LEGLSQFVETGGDEGASAKHEEIDEEELGADHAEHEVKDEL